MTAPVTTPPSLLWDLLAVPATIDHDRPILTFGGRTVELRALQERSETIADRLDARAVAFLDVNSDTAIALMFACFRRGTPFVPLNYRLGAREIHGILTRHRFERLVVGERYRDIAAAVRAAGWDGEIVSAGELEALSPASGQPSSATDESLVLFTSGTSSTPKPIRLRGDAVATHVIGSTPACSAQTRRESLLMSMPLYHVAGVVAVLRSVFAGRRVVVLEQFDAQRWVEAVEREAVSTAFLVPTMLQRVVEVPALPDCSFASLRTITYGGGPMPTQTIRRVLAAFPSHVGFVGTYGLTEAGGTVCVLDEGDHAMARAGDARALQRLGSIGRPLADVRISVRDEHGSVLAPGRSGEILVQSPRAGADVVGADGWLATGDRGYQADDGYVYFIDRKDDMIVRGGENISPAEIEDVLRRAEGIGDCSVFGLRDDEWGHRIVAAIVLTRPPTDDDEAALTTHCRGALAGYKCPDAFVFMDSLPTSPTGKVLKRELVDAAARRVRTA